MIYIILIALAAFGLAFALYKWDQFVDEFITEDDPVTDDRSLAWSEFYFNIDIDRANSDEEIMKVLDQWIAFELTKVS